MRSTRKRWGQARISYEHRWKGIEFLDIWDLTGIEKPIVSLYQTARYKTIVGHNFSQRQPNKEKWKKKQKQKNQIQSWNKDQIEDTIFPSKTTISDDFEVAVLKWTNELIYKTEVESRCRKQTYGYQGMGWGWGDKLGDWDWHTHTTIYKLDN